MALTYNLEHPEGTSVSTAKEATTGFYPNGYYDSTSNDHRSPQIPGKEGPFKQFLLPGMGDSNRFRSGPVRVSSDDVEHLLGKYQPMQQQATREYSGPFAKSGVLSGSVGNEAIEGYTQALDALAAMETNKIHAVATMKVQRFWINQIKSEAWQPFNGWESKVTIFRGGILHQSGLSQWRRINSNPVGGMNNPSSLPGFKTYSTTEEELTGVGYETGWGSDVIDINWLRNVPDAPRKVKEILDFGVDMGLALRESYNRETYINMSNLVHRAFVMCCDCEPYEDSGSRIYIYDPHVKPDAMLGSDVATAAGSSFTYTDGTGRHTYTNALATSYFGKVDDRASLRGNAEQVYVLLDDQMCDCYGQSHAVASYVTDTSGEARPFVLVDVGAAGECAPIEPPNFDMLERLTDQMAQRCAEAAVGSDGDVPIFGITINHSDIDKLIRATPIEWDAWRRAEPQALISHYGISKAKTYRRWAVVNDPKQLRLEPIAYVSEYNSTVAKNYGCVGFRPNDDTHLQGRAVMVCVVVDPLKYSATRRGTNGNYVPVPNDKYFRAPLAIANVYVRDTFINKLEGALPSLGAGTSFGPMPPANGQWGFLNIRDRDENPFGTFGNFYGLLRTHVQPTRYTQEACSFVYARDVQAFRAFTQAENRIINPDYKNEKQNVSVTAAASKALTGSSAVTTIASGTVIDVTLAANPRVALVQSSVVELAKTTGSTVSGNTDCIVLDASLWPRVKVAPVGTLTLANVGIAYNESTGAVTCTGTTLISK